ncbi:MAG: NAD(P)/FAD-dependent oxidoreductase [Myxococcales bacterium]|nr:NAD(P)/FAD-dependent oxidoreductase [Myxococcales bacterium]
MTSRRALLKGAGAAAVVACAPPAREAAIPCDTVAGEVMERGHRVRSPLANRPEPHERVDVAIVGGGVAGLSAAWALRGAGLSVEVYELADEPGGTARSSHGAALGAHYLTLPSPECVHIRAMLHEFGVIEAFDGDGHPRYSPSALCLAPEERLFVGGTFVEGLWPEGVATAEDVRQREAFAALVASFLTRRGNDGRPAFAIPVALSSRDPELRALSQLSFGAWLDAQGFTSPAFRWTMTHACRDDFGVPPDRVSAWAGLHYFASRRPDPSDAVDLGTHVLTWPSGNGWLVGRLRGALEAPPTLGAIVRAVEPDGRLWFERAGDTTIRGVRARAVVLAVPTPVADRLQGHPSPLVPEAAPWLTVQLDVSGPPGGNGVRTAWDTVLYEADGLGYIDNAHFGHTAWRTRGPSTLTWFSPIADRSALRHLTDAAATELALGDLSAAHPEIRRLVTGARACRFGHGTVIPTVGLHALGPTGEPVLSVLATPSGVVERAHTDLSGMSLFEEASFHGITAAARIRARLLG